MEKKAAKTCGSGPNPRNGSVHRHACHMSSSAAAGGVHESNFQRSRSFCGRPSQTGKTCEASAASSSSKLKKNMTTMMRRPKTHPELLSRDDHNMKMKMSNRSDLALSACNKLLVNVTVGQSIGPLRLLLSKDATVEDLIKAALVLYAKEGRKPLLSNDPISFDLHYSQFSIDCLNPADNIKDLGSRNFFLCPKATAKESCKLSLRNEETGYNSSSPCSYSCGKEIQKISRVREPWYNKLLDCLLLPP